MSPKIILALTNDRRHVSAVLDRALALAEPFGAHITALHVRPDPAALMAQVDGQYFATMAASVFANIEKEASESAGAVHAGVEAWRKARGLALTDAPSGAAAVTIGWRDVIGQLEMVIAREGQIADLIVLGRPDPTEAPLDEVALESALFASGRPVLLCPLTGPVSLGGTALVAWNASLESTHAVAAGLPLLARMDKVEVLRLGDASPGDVSSAEVAHYLQAHRIPATSQDIPLPHGGAGKAILDRAQAIGAGLIVMGAYTHSRVRELILGGATRDALRAAPVPVLLTH